MKIKNKILTSIQIERMAAEGKCVAHDDGKVIFVSHVAPGDVVDLRIIKKRRNYLEAVPVKFHTYANDRATPFCEHFGTCGGCKWQHIPYPSQLSFKQQQVADALERIAKVPVANMHEILGSEETTFYRNKLEFTFSNMRWLSREEIEDGQDLERNGVGFHIPGRFDKILDIEKCWLQKDPSNEIRNWLREYSLAENIPYFDLVKQTGYLRILIIRTTSTNETMVILQVAGDRPDILLPLLDALQTAFPKITSLNYVINQKKNETFHDLDVTNYTGTPYITEEMSRPDDPDKKIRFRIGPKSFYQTNSEQAEKLYRIAFDFAGLKGTEVVYDLYTGTGTIATYIAHAAKKVIGIEYVDDAVKDAHVNAEINGITNMDFFAGDMKDILSEEFLSKNGHPDVVITDPPRAGMHEDVIQVLLRAAPDRIVYVSCNPATQARDIALLSEDYDLAAIQPVDMFPHTHHVENVALLKKRNQDD